MRKPRGGQLFSDLLFALGCFGMEGGVVLSLRRRLVRIFAMSVACRQQRLAHVRLQQLHVNRGLRASGRNPARRGKQNSSRFTSRKQPLSWVRFRKCDEVLPGKQTLKQPKRAFFGKEAFQSGVVQIGACLKGTPRC